MQKHHLNIFTTFFLLIVHASTAQLKFVVEDFEGLADGRGDLKRNGIFTFGNTKASIDKSQIQKIYTGDRCITISSSLSPGFGGWGKGLGINIELNAETDYLNFYYYVPKSNDTNSIQIELQDDDDNDRKFDKHNDDSWIYIQPPIEKGGWKMVSIPLNRFRDLNTGGDGKFNLNYKDGKLLCLTLTFIYPKQIKETQTWMFDFICFSKGKLPTGTSIFEPALSQETDFCGMGAWSKEGNTANFNEIATCFENNFKPSSDKKLGLVHFFQPFAVDGGNTQNMYPSVDKINKVITAGYIPMITLEDHFVNTSPNIKQPNLYSITEGHFDSFFTDWAKQIKKVDGVVLLRILHEFNGDWYPWCTVNNDKNPELIIKAFRRIHEAFEKENVTNVRFIWCPNSSSLPQEKWNFILDAYPGDEYVDFVGLDIYNGAGNGTSVWRSFRKEGIENYFLLTQSFPQKPLLVCETASRERKPGEQMPAQDKGDWIRQMSEALKTDMSEIKLISWFNEKETFKINTSKSAQNAFLKYVLQDDYFKGGTKELNTLIAK